MYEERYIQKTFLHILYHFNFIVMFFCKSLFGRLSSIAPKNSQSRLWALIDKIFLSRTYHNISKQEFKLLNNSRNEH